MRIRTPLVRFPFNPTLNSGDFRSTRSRKIQSVHLLPSNPRSNSGQPDPANLFGPIQEEQAPN